MATKKDLVEAHSFSRRRLVTAFLSGAPGGREVEPSRPGRTIVGGIALSVLLVAGAAIASVLSARTPEDWNQPGLIASQGSGALYAILAQEDTPVLYPIINTTSAQLIFGATASPTSVERETVNEQAPGPTIGIFNAPAELPITEDLITTGWTACTGDGLGIKVNVDLAPRVDPGDGYGFTVRTEDDDFYLITAGDEDGGPRRTRAYALPDDLGADDLLVALGVDVREDAITVPGDWLRLFEAGDPLGFESFGFSAAGPPPASLRGVPGAEVGAYVPFSNGSGAVITPEGLLQLEPFALAVYANSIVPGTSNLPAALPLDTDLPPTPSTGNTYADAHWPAEPVAEGTPPGQACAVLVAEEGERPAVQLGIDPQGEASAASVADPTQRPVVVLPGHGSFVYSGTFEDLTTESPFVVASTGDIYPLADRESISKLGYAGVDAPVVPDQWIRLFDGGVALSTTAALCPPVPDPEDDPVNQVSECQTFDAG